MNEKLLSKDFQNDLERITGKRIEEICEEDLNKIERMKLNLKNFDGTNKDYHLHDLSILKNLRSLTLSHFPLTKEELVSLNRLPHLSFLHFDFCEFKGEELFLDSSVAHVIFDGCHMLSMNMLHSVSAEHIQVIGSEREKRGIDILDMGCLENLKELSLNNFTINNMNEILKVAPNIKSLNLDGSLVKDISKLDLPGVEVSSKARYIEANA